MASKAKAATSKESAGKGETEVSASNPLGVAGASIKEKPAAGEGSGRVVVAEDVYEERPLPGSDLTTRILVATAGSVVTEEYAKAHGIGGKKEK